MRLSWIPEGAPPASFPPVERALTDPDGLLAVGGDLEVPRLIEAYRRGIFPWFSDGQPILWWCPDPRAVLFPSELKVSRSLRKRIRRGEYRVSENLAFSRVIRACAAPRGEEAGTWITASMLAAYEELHRRGYAHSVECWSGEELAGGLYGIRLGRVFFGESMFTRRADASKVALAHLCSGELDLVDCQLPNPHLETLGARRIARREFVRLLDRWCAEPQPRLAV